MGKARPKPKRMANITSSTGPATPPQKRRKRVEFRRADGTSVSFKARPK